MSEGAVARAPGLTTKQVTVYRSGRRGVSPRGWCQLATDYKVKMDRRGVFSVHVPASSPWWSGLWEAVRAAVRASRLGMAALVPCLALPLRCTALLQQQGTAGSFGLVVALHHEDQPQGSRPDHVPVGGALTAKLLKPGSIRVRVVSTAIQADLAHGEHPQLSKVEHSFNGQPFDVQFACTARGGKLKGVFGKVILEQLTEEGVKQVFEFNLNKGANDEERRPPPDDKWSVLAVRELASMLNVLDEENWRRLATQLGFTDHEVTLLAATPDPFSSTLVTYQSRGGAPDQFVTSLYEVSRALHVGGYVTRSPSRDSNYSSLHPANVESRLLGDFPENDELQDIDSASQLCGGVNTHSKYNMPPTPPPTPAKRKRSTETTPSKKVRRCLDIGYDTKPQLKRQDSSDTLILDESDNVIVTPSKRLSNISVPLRRMHRTETADTLILDETEAVQECRLPSRLRRTSSQTSSMDEADDSRERACSVPVGPTTLWHVSGQLSGQWKDVGLLLDVPRSDLTLIESEHRELRERAYQMLLSWQKHRPRDFVYGALYSALCDCGLRTVAQRYCKNRI